MDNATACPRRHPIIVLEFNELVPRLMDRFISEGYLPNFAALREISRVYTTDTIDHGVRELEPWVQYCCSHTGVRAGVHGMWNLAEGKRYKGPRYWDVAARHGLRVMLWSSMNIGLQPGFKGVVLPDPWSSDSVQVQPPELLPFVSYIQKNVQEHSRKEAVDGRSDTLRFLWFLLTHGGRWSTLGLLARQLMQERGGRYRWRRAFALDRIIADAFCYYFLRCQPDLATLFLNSTAFVQHRYWRNMEPDHFRLKPTQAEQEEFATAILEGYRSMDAIVAQVRRAAPDARVVLCTAHSQQPHTAHESQGGKIWFRPVNFASIVTLLGLTGVEKIEPVMAEQFRLHFSSPSHAQAAEAALRSTTLDEEQVFECILNGSEVFCGSRIHHPVGSDACIEIGSDERRRIPFHDVFYRVDGVKSGRHHPEGILWIESSVGARQDFSQKVPITCVAPTILQMLNLEVPEEMTDPGLEFASYREREPDLIGAE